MGTHQEGSRPSQGSGTEEAAANLMNWLLIAALVERGSFLPSNWLSGPAWQAPGVLGEAGWPWGWREASAQALPWEAVGRGELAPCLGPQGSHFPG